LDFTIWEKHKIYYSKPLKCYDNGYKFASKYFDFCFLPRLTLVLNRSLLLESFGKNKESAITFLLHELEGVFSSVHALQELDYKIIMQLF
jgi:hypothetical protein